MTAFDEQFATDAAPLLMEQFGEPVIYIPRSGVARTIEAMVTRGPPDAPAEFTEAMTPFVTITVKNDPETGISSRLLDTGGDQVELPLWEGQKPTRLQIKRRLSQHDAAMLDLECR